MLSSVAIGAGASTGDVAVTGSVVVDVATFDTEAYIGDGAQVNQSSTYQTGSGSQSINVAATDTTKMINVAGGIARRRVTPASGSA